MRVELPCGAFANVSPDVKPETLEALNEVMKAAESSYGRLPMPINEGAVAWAEEAMAIADVLRQLSDKFDGIDNGRCTVCCVGHRLWKVPGKVKGPCDYETCLSHRISKILEGYEKPTKSTLERIKQNCLERITQECFCGTELEAGICPNGHDPLSKNGTK